MTKDPATFSKPARGQFWLFAGLISVVIIGIVLRNVVASPDQRTFWDAVSVAGVVIAVASKLHDPYLRRLSRRVVLLKIVAVLLYLFVDSSMRSSSISWPKTATEGHEDRVELAKRITSEIKNGIIHGGGKPVEVTLFNLVIRTKQDERRLYVRFSSTRSNEDWIFLREYTGEVSYVGTYREDSAGCLVIEGLELEDYSFGPVRRPLGFFFAWIEPDFKMKKYQRVYRDELTRLFRLGCAKGR